MLELSEIQTVLDQIKYKDWVFAAVASHNRLYLQITFEDVNAVTGRPETAYCRKWLLSPFMSRSEIVRTAMKAVLTAEEHEARERFTYRDHSIFAPHFDVDALVNLSEQKALDKRTALAESELSNT